MVSSLGISGMYGISAQKMIPKMSDEVPYSSLCESTAVSIKSKSGLVKAWRVEDLSSMTRYAPNPVSGCSHEIAPKIPGLLTRVVDSAIPAGSVSIHQPIP